MFRQLRLTVLFGIWTLSFAVGQSTNEKTTGVPSPATTQGVSTAASANLSTPGGGGASTDAAVVTLPKLFADASAFYRQGNFSSAIATYQLALQREPKSPEAYVGLTRVYLKQKNVELASQTVTKGMSLVDSPELHVALGEVDFRQGKINPAEREWVDVINSGHADARAYLGLARVRNSFSMYKKGKAMIDKAHELDPTDPEIQREWTATLPRAERIKYFENYLASADDNDAEERENTQRYLEYMRARAKASGRSCHLVSKMTSTETPLVRLLIDPTHLRGYGLTVQVNEKTTHLMLDTGASGILLDRGAAEKAGVTRLSQTEIGGIGDKGRKAGYFGLAKSIKVGGLEFQDCTVEVLENRSVVGEEGLIGADVFEDFLVDIDFPKEKFRISELPRRPEDPVTTVELHQSDGESEAEGSQDASSGGTDTMKPAAVPPKSRFHDAYVAPEMKSYTKFFRFGHEILVPTEVDGTPWKLFLLDSGSFDNQITPAAAREITKVRGDSDTTVKGISGSVKTVYRADKAALQFGHIRQQNEDLVAFDLTNLSENTGTEVSGILGFIMMRFLDIKIDYRDGLLDCSYDRKFWGR